MASARARSNDKTTGPVVRRATAAPEPSYAVALGAAVRLNGARVADGLGRERIDLRNADGAVLLGWADPQVEAAAAAASPADARLEPRAAGLLSDLIPSAEAVVFGATVQGAVAEALLAAKAVTGRDGAFFCDDDTAVTGDLIALDRAVSRYDGEVAALVIRPMDASAEFLAGARAIADAVGAVLIFDETRTLLRVHSGGAQALTGVMPDLTVCGAVMANGRPLAAVAGRMEVMRGLNGAGSRPSAASLGAACATLTRVAKGDVVPTLRIVGAEIEAEVEARLHQAGAGRLLGVYGDPTWSLVAALGRPPAESAGIEAALSHALYDHDILSFGAHVPSCAIREAEIARLLDAYEAVLPGVVAQAAAGRFAGAA